MTGVKFYADTPPEGYGVAARRMMAGLDRLGVPLTFSVEFGRPEERAARVQADPLLARLAGRPITYDTVVIHSSVEHWPRLAAAEPGKVIIGAMAWETDRPPAGWQAAARAVSRAIVPCEWNRRVLLDAGWPGPIDVVPHVACEAADLPAPVPVRGLGIRPTDYVFYTIGVWSARKAFDETLRTFCRAFRWRRDTVLVMKTTRLDLQTEVRHQPRVPARLKARILTWATAPWARVRLLTGTRPAGELTWLHQRGDCYLNFSRGEGWGLGLFDAMTLGKTAISTAHGGPLDYLGREAFVVAHREVPVRPRNFERAIYTDGMHWAEPDWAEAAQRMREIRTAPEEARRRAAPAAARIQREFGWRPVTECVLEVFRRAHASAGPVSRADSGPVVSRM